MAVLNRALERVQPRSRAQVRLGMIVAITIGAAALLALLQVIQNSDAAVSNFEIQRLEREKLELQTRVSDLEAEVAELGSLPRIERAARERLGLVPPEEREHIQVNVPWSVEEQGLPSRFAPDEDVASAPKDETSWWEEALQLLPFY